MSVSVLEYARANDIILLCFPSHTTHFLQPLDRSFFRPLKHYFRDACNNWMLNHFRPKAGGKDQGGVRKIGRMQFGGLLCKAWGQSATPQNGISGFKASGVVPLDINAIPDHAYVNAVQPIENLQQDISNGLSECSPSNSNRPNTHQIIQETLPQETNLNCVPSITHGNASTNSKNGNDQEPNQTPTKLLNIISPIPKVMKPSVSNKRKQGAENLTSDIFIKVKKEKHDQKQKKLQKKESKNNARNSTSTAMASSSTSELKKPIRPKKS